MKRGRVCILLLFLAANPMNAQWTSIGPEGGKVFKVLQHPGNADILWAFTENYPCIVYKSVDKGESWTWLSQISDAPKDVEVNPSNGNHLYFTSGRYIITSSNGGVSWDQKPYAGVTYMALEVDPVNSGTLHLTGSEYVQSKYIGFYYKSTVSGQNVSSTKITDDHLYVYDIAVDPTDVNRIYICGDNGDWNPVIMRTTDGGTAWQDITGTDMSSTIYDVAVEPTAGKVYACSYSKVYFSSNHGVVWNQCNGSAGGYRIAIDPQNTSIVYTARSGRIYRSTNGGQSFTSYTSGLTEGIVTDLKVDRENTTRLFIANQNGIYQSTNSGADWAVKNSGIANMKIMNIQTNPSAPNELFVGTYEQGLFKTSDGLAKTNGTHTVEWTPVSNFGNYYITTLNFFPGTPDIVYVSIKYG